MADPEGPHAPPSHHLPHLDGLRGLAALTVVLYHITWRDPLASSIIARHGWAMVDFFFVLSGFVIALNYAERLTGAANLRAFVWKRFARLYPLHLLMLGAFVAVEALKWWTVQHYGLHGDARPFQENSVASLLPNLLLLQGLGVLDHLTWNWPSWSISAEFYTYIAFGLIFLAARKRLVVLTLACLGIALAGIMALYICIPAKMLDVTYDFGFVRCLTGFALGVTAYQATKAFGSRDARIGPQVLQWSLAAFCVWLACQVRRGDALTLALPFCFAALVFALAAWRRGSLEAVFSIRPLRALGAWSYSIYMTHALIVVLAQNAKPLIERRFAVLLEPQVQLVWNTSLSVAILAGVIILSAITYTTVERPMQKLLLTLSTASKRPAPATPKEAPQDA